MAIDPKKSSRLGRGLDALIPQSKPAPVAGPPREPTVAGIEEVHPNRAQPRTRFDEGKLDELAQAVKALGVLEPILVRKRNGGGFEIIAGERRWRAAQRAGLREVPIVVRELSSTLAFEAAIVENLQREDLNPIETARAFQRLLDDHKHSQDSIAQKIGKDRSTVANALRLLKLPASVLEHIENGDLSEGHGRALLTAPSTAIRERLAKEAVAKQWSVRETERQARHAGDPKPEPKPKSANVRDLEIRLSKSLGARVTLTDNGEGKGAIHVTYTSLDELDRILAKLG
ncbi:MAG: ParB/RepB/Spo0J family partition protein [Sandaracinaceae bacterium]|nr:ParB/RepB/Spo0J family partition protein [Sandaracinaceae bacterium]